MGRIHRDLGPPGHHTERFWDPIGPLTIQFRDPYNV